mmetsp:Transcript_84141/g.238716  ORF Transcript_84141/g.238716 Transcript_84141/m.238716 type:complete len:381 (+) Transcript_84141:1262-2404(+)
MKSTHWSTQASSSMCSTTCEIAMHAARACLQSALGACMAALMTLLMIGMRTSSLNVSARRSKFSSAMLTTTLSQVSSSSFLPSAVHMARSSSTSSIHSMLRLTRCSRRGCLSTPENSSWSPRARDIAASMAPCRTSSSEKASAPAEQSFRRVAQSSAMPLSLKNSGSASIAEVKDVSTSFRGSSWSSFASACSAATTAGITAVSGAAFSGSRISTNFSTRSAAPARTSADASERAERSIAFIWSEFSTMPSPTVATRSFRIERATTRLVGSEPAPLSFAIAGKNSGHSFVRSTSSVATVLAIAQATCPALRFTALLGSPSIEARSCAMSAFCAGPSSFCQQGSRFPRPSTSCLRMTPASCRSSAATVPGAASTDVRARTS